MAFADEVIELKPNVELKNQVIEGSNTYKYYKIKIEGSSDGGLKDDSTSITIKTSRREEHPWSNPDVYISKDSQEPNQSLHQIGKRGILCQNQS